MKHYRLPNFLIVGTMKSGTSTLADYLTLNPEIHMPNRELHYFNKNENYSKGPKWYSKKLTKEIDNIKTKETFLIGEKTPTYSYQANCAIRIKKTIPNVKLIWIFRNPIKRTFSNYLHAKRKGAEILTFRQCVKREQERIKQNIFHGYVERSKYIIQLERFLNLFNLSNMHFLLFEDLIKSPEKEINKIAEFLGVAKFEELPEIHSNPTVMPFSPTLQWITRKTVGYDSKLYILMKKLNYKLGSLVSKTKPSIPDDLIKHLSNLFKPYNERLSKVTGLDLSVWKFPKE